MSLFWGGQLWTPKHVTYVYPLVKGWRLYGVTIGWFFIGYIRRS